MRYRIRHTTKYAYTDPVAVCQNLVRLAPRSSAGQRVESYRLVVAPEPSDLESGADLFGNRVDYFSIQDAHRSLSLTAFSDVEVAPPPVASDTQAWESVRDLLSGEPAAHAEAFRFVFPSTHTPVDTRLADYAAPSFPAGRPLLESLDDLTGRVYDDFDYRSGSTTIGTTVLESLERRVGVCQDFAHFQIACLRSLGLAARYVSGYLRTEPAPGQQRLVGADESHAWIGVWHPEVGWVDFDPTNNCRPATDHVTVAVGRDYADVCPIQGVFVGGGSHTLSVAVDVAAADEQPES